MNSIESSRPLRGAEAFVYGLKDRARKQHCLGYGTFSVEIDVLEQARKEYARVVQPISYAPIYVKATALTLQAHPEANAILFKSFTGRRIVQFADVDVNLPITRKIGDRIVTSIATIRDAARKPLAEIQRELTVHQKDPLEESPAWQRLRRFESMPLWLARLVHWRMTWSPEFYIRNVGTCGLTMLDSKACDHLYPIAPTSVVFGLGSPRRQPVVRGEELGIGRVMPCSIMVDNFVISGLLGARLGETFKDLLESARFLTEELTQHVQRPLPAGSVS